MRPGDALLQALLPRAQTLLRVRGLTVRVHGAVLLGPVSLDLGRSGMNVLLGPREAGKTLLMEAINRMAADHPAVTLNGEVALDGEDILQGDLSPRALRRRVVMIPAPAAVLPGSVYDNLAFALRLHRAVPHRAVMDERLTAVLEVVGLWSSMRSRLDQGAEILSPAEATLVALARALTLDPQIMMVDDPLHGLGVAEAARVETILRMLARDRTLLVATRQPGWAGRFGGRTLFLDQGRLIEAGDSAQVFTRPRAAATEAYITGFGDD